MVHSQAREDDRPESVAGTREEERVITLGWQAVVLPVVAIAVVAAGFFFGRAMLGGGAADPVQPPNVSPTAVQVPIVPINPGEGEVIELPPAQALSLFPQDKVVELPVPNHALLNRPAPDFTMTLLETGEEVSLSDYAGQWVMVNFWATWCPPCRFEMPWIQSVYEARQEDGFVVLAVNAGERVPPSMVEDTIRQFVDFMGLTFPMLWGDNAYEVQRQWKVTGLPATFVVDPDGTVVDVHQGMFPNQVTLEYRVNRLLDEELGSDAP